MLVDDERMGVPHRLMGMGMAVGFRPFPAVVMVIVVRVFMAVQMTMLHGRMSVLQDLMVLLRPKYPAEKAEGHRREAENSATGG